MRALLRVSLAAAALLAQLAAPSWAKNETFCGGTEVPLTVTPLHSPYVRGSVGGEAGYFQIDTGSSISTVDARIFRRPVGAAILLDRFAFPTFERGRFIALTFGAVPAPSDGRQIGQIGTDMLTRRAIEFHYEATPPYLVISDRPCSAAQLQAAGFVSIAQRGYFGHDRSRLGNVIDNTPVVFMRIGGVTVPAWIDSGFVESTSTGLVQANEPMIDALRKAGVGLSPAGEGKVTNCHGENFTVKLWRVVGVPMQIATEEGHPILTYGAPGLAVAPRNSCSGPGNIDVPVARIGAAYLNLWGTFVLDALSERVWLSPRRARAPGLVLAGAARRRAMVIAEGQNGTVTITTADTLGEAKTRALANCTKGGMACTVKISLDPAKASCAAMARSEQETTKITLATRSALEDAKKAALDQCTLATHGECTVQFSGCNG